MRSWSANTWVLTVFGVIIVLAGIDIGRRMLQPATGDESPTMNEQAEASTPAFKVGDPAPDFTLPDSSGTNRSLSGLVKKDSLLLFTCGCSNCKDIESYLSQILPKMKRRPDVISVTSAKPDAEKAWFRDTRLPHPILYDQDNLPVMEMYKGHPCPRVYRLTGDRKITWIGPSMSEYPTPDIAVPDMGNRVAENLGFHVPGHSPAPMKGPKAPVMVRGEGAPAIGLPAGTPPPSDAAPRTARKKTNVALPPYAGRGNESPI